MSDNWGLEPIIEEKQSAHDVSLLRPKVEDDQAFLLQVAFESLEVLLVSVGVVSF